MADSTEFLLGKISGQLDGFEQRLDELRDGVAGMGRRQTSAEERVGKLEREAAHRNGIFTTIAGLCSVAGGGIVAFLGKKFGG
jgi:hypothetical protein